MRSVKVTCLMLLVGLTCLGLALVAAAPGQQAPPADPKLAIGSGVDVPAPPSAGDSDSVPGTLAEVGASTAPPTAASGLPSAGPNVTSASRARQASLTGANTAPRSASAAPSGGAGAGMSPHQVPWNAAQADAAQYSDAMQARESRGDTSGDIAGAQPGYSGAGSGSFPVEIGGGMGGMGAGWGGMFGMGGRQDPEAAKQFMEAAKAEQEQHRLLTNYAQSTDEKQRAAIKEALSKVLQRQFDLQIQQREREVSQIEARVKKLREMIAKRNAARQTIVTGRLDQLLNEMDGMGWVAPSGPMSPSGSYQYYSRPGLNRGGASGGNTVKRSSDQPEEPKAVSWGIAPGGAGTESGPASTRSGGGSIGPGGAGTESASPASTRPDAGSSGPGGASGRQKSAPKL